MIDTIKKFFGKRSGVQGSSEKGGAPHHDIRVATCALFLEMANIDGEFSESEKAHVVSALQKDHGLSDADARALIEASELELKGSIDLWQFTNRINENYSREEKLQIIETVWEIAYRDKELDKYEDYLAHKLAKLLRLTHKELIDAKLRVKERFK